MRFRKSRWAILAIVIIVIAVFAAFRFNGKDKPEYFTARVQRGDVREVVEATGTINAVTTVQVGSQVSGNIQKLYADFNSKVKAGQVVARLDPSLFEGALLQAKADLENARANLAAAKANLEKAKASASQTKADYERTVSLTREGVMSQQQLDLAKANYDSAAAAVSASQAQVTQASAQVNQRSAAVSVAETNLGHTIIRAPIDGIVTNRAVDVGQTVAASLQAPTLFTIAQDLTKMQVYAKTDESDVGMIKPGQKVTFKVDAFPKDTFSGTVSQVRMNPTTVQNVVTYDTIVNFDNPELKLFPGMTAYISIPVAEAQNVLKVPNGALRFRPDLKPEELRALLEKYGMHGAAERGGSRAGGGFTQGEDSARARQRSQAETESERPGGAAPTPAREPHQDVATVWKLRADKSLEPVRIKAGITDHTVTEVQQVLKGELKEGEELVIGSANVKGQAGGPGAPRMGPGMGGGPPRR